MFETFLSILYWFARPSIAAWAGAVATVVAVFLAEPRRHLRAPLRFLGRIPRIIIVWLIIAFLLSQLAGRGAGGAGSGGGRGDTQGPWVFDKTSDGSAAYVVKIRFVAQPGKTELASDFLCIVRIETQDGVAEERKLMADTLADFEQQLERRLRSLSDRPSKLIVERMPYPGEGVLRLIHSQVEKIWPDLPYEEVAP
ncbi:MAG: hypothetical protein U0796_02975 [Gemmatales bacterium]